MSLFLKLSACCILCGILSLSIKKHSPELSFVMMLASLIACVAVAADIFSEMKHQLSSTLDGMIITEHFRPLLKCCCISIITQVSCGLCKDAGQAAAASGLEFVGSLVSVFCLLPLINALFSVIGGLL